MGEAICIVVVVQIPCVGIVVVVTIIFGVVIVVVELIVVVIIELVAADVVLELLRLFLSMLSSLFSQPLFKLVLAGVSCIVLRLWNRLEFWLVIGILRCVFRILFPDHLFVLGACPSHLLKHSVFFHYRVFRRVGFLGLESRRERSLVRWIGFSLLLLSKHLFLTDLVEE
jgi:hypothetical protein